MNLIALWDSEDIEAKIVEFGGGMDDLWALSPKFPGFVGEAGENAKTFLSHL